MTDTTRSTQLRDDKGQSHFYSLTLFPASAGLRLGDELLDVLGQTLRLEGGQVGSAISGFARAIAARGHEDFVLRLLEHVVRDGQRLSERHVFEAAFMGNYGELLRVLDWVVRENFGGFSEAALEVVGGRVQSLIQSMSAGLPSSWMSVLLTSASGESSTPDSGRGAKSRRPGR